MSAIKIPGELSVSFRYTPGVGNLAFFEALRDRGVFLGSRCDECGVTYLPARIFCERCLAELEPSVECGPEGEVVSWTLVRVDVDDQPLDRPVTYGLVRLDRRGHRAAPPIVGHERVNRRSAQRVRAVFASDREGSMLDVEGFAPADGGTGP